jgi:DNA helicase HerA-like ATPase
MAAGYALDEPSIVLGSPMLGDELLNDTRIRLALSMANRHGLLAGQLSKAGVPVFISDIKGDVSGMGAPGDATNEKVVERIASLDWTFEPSGHPIELLSLSGMLGAQVRATVSSFGPLLLGKVLDINETQTSILSLVFKYCDDNNLPLLDLADLTTTLKFLASDEGKAILEDYGGMSSASVGVLLRSLIVLEQEGVDAFFGEPEFDVGDLLRTTPDGLGIVSILELPDVMDQPRLFSTFMLWLLARLYEYLPEVGDLPKPKLVFFFDEAHLLFDDASEALMDQIERTARLIRSKGVGVYFVTHAPTDVPSSVLAQLGNRVQHALRAFTPDDADALRKTARTFPITEHYDVEKTITSLGIGEALVTVLSPRGIPTPLAATRLIPPDSQMAPLPPADAQARIAASLIATKYATAIDRESAHEIIAARLVRARAAAAQVAMEETYRSRAAPTTAGGLNTMTPAQQQREIARQAREIAAAERAAERARKAEERRQASLERVRVQQERARQRQVETAIRTGGKVLTSRAGQDIIRGVFGTLFGRRK